jgi:hypothetical protein
MNRELILAIVTAILIPLCPAQQKTPEEMAQAAAAARQKDRQTAIQMNELAGHIHSLDDARRLVNMVAKEFADDLPPAWATAGLRERVAEAEYRSATNPTQLIPEQRVADAWNRYVDEIGTPRDALVTAAEIHSMRDADYTAMRFAWTRIDQSMWTMPNIYALGPDGKVANGCRALEAVLVVWRMANYYEEIGAARNRVKLGIVESDLFRKQEKKPVTGRVQTEVRFSTGSENPIESAERRYVSEHGMADFSRVVVEMMRNLFPDKGRN